MKEINITQKKHAQSDGFYQLVLPLDLEVLIPDDDSVRLLREVMEGLDYSKLYKAYS
jgi:transposase